MNIITALIPLIPLFGFIIIGVNFRKLPKKLTAFLASTTVLVSFVLSIILFISILNTKTPISYNLFEWIDIYGLRIPFAFYVDQLTSIMLLIITGVGFLIHVYSVGYMWEDAGFNRFFAYMNLFIFSMLLLVLGENYLIMFIGWEGVGLCSYLLIGFWFKNTAYNNAAKKAFIMNRIGDLGFLLGIFMILFQFGSISYSEVFSKALVYTGSNSNILIITLLLFVGAVGKSAQIPLYTWLPDAMAGPTPVSALIHAATMVTAGIYMIARSNILYALAPISLSIVAIVGISTALFAAIIAIFQNDIKKVLAYSTVSQLGYMFLALGVGAFTGAVFHLITHAFFKALLFLGAGSVIHALHGEQDIRNMGGLKSKLKYTFAVFLIATLAIAGIPPFSGFFSKDEILAHVFDKNIFLWILATVGALITTFYMFRLLYLTFYGKTRITEKQEHHLHESPKIMIIPLIILAVLSIFGGFIGIPEFLGGTHSLNSFLAPVFGQGITILAHSPELTHQTELILALGTLVLIFASVFWAYYKYVRKLSVAQISSQNEGFVKKIISNKFYVDEFYTAIIEKPILWFSDIFYKIIEIRIIDKFVEGISKTVMYCGDKIRLLQTGTTGFYLVIMVISIIGILWYYILN